MFGADECNISECWVGLFVLVLVLMNVTHSGVHFCNVRSTYTLLILLYIEV